MQAVIVAYLAQHHRYEGGRILKETPVVQATMAGDLAETETRVSRAMKKLFGEGGYLKALCRKQLGAQLRQLQDEPITYQSADCEELDGISDGRQIDRIRMNEETEEVWDDR